MKQILGNTYYNRSELADLLSVSLPTVSKLLDSGDLPSRKLGKERLVSEEEVRQYLSQTA